MAKNYFSRYVWLIDLINRRRYITLPEINRAWRQSSLNEGGQDIPERTFFNHKDAILDIFGLEIKCDRSLGYYIANSSEIRNNSIRTWLLQSLSMNNIINEGRNMLDRILFEPIPSSQRFLTDIIFAMRENRVIRITYKSYLNPEPRTFNVEPYCLKIFRLRWYMLAKVEDREQARIYSLDRIVDMEEVDATFELPVSFDAEKFFQYSFGIIVEDKAGPEEVKLKVVASQAQYFRSLPLHHTQEETETTDQWSIFQYKIIPTFDFWQEVLSKGDTVEVLSPDWFRRWVADSIASMNKIYNDTLPL